MSFVYFQKKKSKKRKKGRVSLVVSEQRRTSTLGIKRNSLFWIVSLYNGLSASPFTTWSRDFRARLANWSEARKVFCHDSNFMKSTLIIRKNRAGRKISALFVCFLFGFATNLILIFQQISASLFKGVPLRVCQPLPFHSTYQLKHSSTLSLKIS